MTEQVVQAKLKVKSLVHEFASGTYMFTQINQYLRYESEGHACADPYQQDLTLTDRVIHGPTADRLVTISSTECNGDNKSLCSDKVLK